MLTICTAVVPVASLNISDPNAVFTAFVIMLIKLGLDLMSQSGGGFSLGWWGEISLRGVICTTGTERLNRIWRKCNPEGVVRRVGGGGFAAEKGYRNRETGLCLGGRGLECGGKRSDLTGRVESCVGDFLEKGGEITADDPVSGNALRTPGDENPVLCADQICGFV